MKPVIFALASLLLFAACTHRPELPLHAEKNSVYYWRTVLDLDSANLNFIRRHDIGRVYLRMFDVVEGEGYALDERVVPNATVKVGDEEYRLLVDSLVSLEFVPVVYITLDALKKMNGDEGALAKNIVDRVKNMCSYNGLPNVEELQLDCDWTASTEQSFFALCDSVKTVIARRNLPWRLSSTIRLHQLARKAPPVDAGVLMVYNTGSFNDPDATNSILDANDVNAYLKHLSSYPVHLDVAYPTYSWQLLFHKREFAGLLNGLSLNDSVNFTQVADNQYKALTQIPYNDSFIRAGDIVRQETSSASEILKVKSMIDTRLSGKPHSNILYHLDNDNLSKYSDNEINDILAAGN